MEKYGSLRVTSSGTQKGYLCMDAHINAWSYVLALSAPGVRGDRAQKIWKIVSFRTSATRQCSGPSRQKGAFDILESSGTA